MEDLRGTKKDTDGTTKLVSSIRPSPARSSLHPEKDRERTLTLEAGQQTYRFVLQAATSAR